MTLLTVSDVSKKGEEGFVLRNINFIQRRLQKIAIAGETGSGKSSLLKIIAGLIQPDSGEVVFEGSKVIGPDEKLVPGHPGIAYLSQHFELPKSLRVEQVLTYANTIADDEADLVFRICEITHLLKRRTDQLSGGEKQRIAIARLLIGSPSLLLLDEPFSHLDLAHKNTLKNVIRKLSQELKITCILVSHDPADTLSWADKIIVLRTGEIVQQGTPEKIYRQPVSEYVAGLFGNFNLVDGSIGQALKLNAPNKKKRLFFRPEAVLLRDNKKSSFKAMVHSVSYFGSHVDFALDFHGTTIIGRTTNHLFKREAEVFFTLSLDQVHWL